MAKKTFLRARTEDARKTRKEDIIEAAIFIIEKEGFSKLTMSAVAKKSKLGKATLYGYFATREDLLLQVLQNDFDSWFMNFYAYLKTIKNPFGEEFITFWIEEIIKNPRLAGGFLYLVSNDEPELATSFSEKWHLYLFENLKEMHYEIISNFNPTISFEKVSDLFVAITGITTGLWAQSRVNEKTERFACKVQEMTNLKTDFAHYVKLSIKGLLSLPEYKELKELHPLQK